MNAASEKAGSDYKLAQMLDVHRATVSQWRSGKKSCPVADVALMASIAGFNADEWAARAIVSQYEGTTKGDKLYRALGKALLVTGAATVSAGANALPIFSREAVSHFIRCIEVLSFKRFYRNLKTVNAF